MRYETTTSLAPDEALEWAKRFFAGDYELPVQHEGPGEVRFERGGGYVVVRLQGENPTTLELEAEAWEGVAKAFLEQVPR